MRGLLACLTITALVGACTPEAEPTSTTVSPSPTIINQRVSVVDVPAEFDATWLEFATAASGYAMFTRHLPDVTEARLFSTADGGITWVARGHPKPVSKEQQLYVVDARTVALMTGEDEWHVSTDGMATWQRGGRYGYATGDGPFYVDCRDDTDCVIRSQAEPALQRPLPGDHRTLTNIGGGRYWLAGVRNGAPVTQLDGVDVPVPAQPGRKVYHAQVMVSQDRADTWLVADQEPLEMSSGPTARALKNSVQAKPCSCAARVGAQRPTLAAAGMKATGLPLIWQLEGSVWVPRSTSKIREKANWPYPVAPAGDGVLLISGPEGVVAFPGGSPLGVPMLDWIGQTRDGTVYGRPHADRDAIYLSTGVGTTREWFRVALSRS